MRWFRVPGTRHYFGVAPVIHDWITYVGVVLMVVVVGGVTVWAVLR